MVLSCSLRDFLSPLGMEIRLGLCKRIFFFSFFPPLLFFMFVVQDDLFGNLIWIFFSLTTAFFFNSLFAVTQNTDICPMDVNRGEFWKCPIFRLEEGKNRGFKLLLPFILFSKNSSFEMKTYHRTLAAFNNSNMDNYQLED